MAARVHVGDACPICKDSVISNMFTTIDELECFKSHPWGKHYKRHWMEDVFAALENPTQTSLPLEEPKPVKKVIDEYPHRCPHCGAKAYLGIVPGTTVHHKYATEAWSCDNSRRLRQGPAR